MDGSFDSADKRGESASSGGNFRLNQAIARAGICSRRKADALIMAGKVRLNGEIAANPAIRVSAGDRLEVNGKILDKNQPLCHIMLNKPARIMCTAHDPEGRQTVLDILPPEFAGLRLFPVGRLDFFSEGLLLLTNDGGFAQRLAHPSHQVKKVYEVTVRGDVQDSDLAAMNGGMTLADGTKLLPVKASAKKLKNGDTVITMHLRQGINRQIRRMCATVGLVILKLKRVAEGALKLGNLPVGKTRRLTASEVAALMGKTEAWQSHSNRRNSADTAVC